MFFMHEQDRFILKTTINRQTSKNNNRNNDAYKREKVTISWSPLTSIRAAGQRGQSLQRHQEAQPESPESWVHGVRVSRELDGTGPAESVSAARTWCAKQPHNSHSSNS